MSLVDVEAAKVYDLSENDQELGTKHVGTIINVVQQLGIKYYLCNVVAQKMYDIKFVNSLQYIIYFCIPKPGISDYSDLWENCV